MRSTIFGSYLDFIQIFMRYVWFIFSNFLFESECMPSLNIPSLRIFSATIRVFFFVVMYQVEFINIWTKFGKNSQIVWQTWLSRLQLFWNEFRPMKFTFWHFKWYILSAAMRGKYNLNIDVQIFGCGLGNCPKKSLFWCELWPGKLS